jgi:preprotein translocase subunit YajC
MFDAAYDLTEERIKRVEKEIEAEYKRAEKEVKEKLDDHFERYRKKDEEWRKKVKAGKKTEAEYKKWRTGQLAIGKRWEEMRKEIAHDYANASNIARSIVTGYTPDVYALNYNFGTYEIEHGARIDTSFTLYSAETVERLMREHPTLLPPPGKAKSEAIRMGLEERWDEKQLQSVLVQGILQGESIPKIAARLATEVGDKSMKSAIRNARTMMTGAQNAGRIDSYKRAESLVIETNKRWLATHDGRTRDWHIELDEVSVPVDEPFVNEYGEIDYPGDPGADPANVYNCRCCLVSDIKHVKSYSERLKEYEKAGNMSFKEWEEDKEEKQSKEKQEEEPSPSVGKKRFDTYRANFYSDVEYNEVKDLSEPLTEEQIIAKIGGGDKTKGSCASLAYSYAANKAGWDVRDFRGGNSCSLFAESSHSIPFMSGLDTKFETDKNGLEAAKKALQHIEQGKEYVFAAGHHCAVVRIGENGKYQYLELQTNENNGWLDFSKNTEWTLRDRFNVRKTEKNRANGSVTEQTARLTDVENFKKSKEFREALGYLNTVDGKEKKGKGGYAK